MASFQKTNYDKGRPYLIQAIWFALSNLVFMKWWCPRFLRTHILRFFGASIGENVFIRHRVRILWPWKLTVGNNSWLGEDLWILNLEPVVIGNDVCLSQNVILCTGNHNFKSENFIYMNAQIRIGDGAWIAIGSLILPGVTIGKGATIMARSMVSRNVLDYEIVRSQEN